MALAFRSANETVNSTASNSCVVTAPSGIADDDILLFSLERAAVTEASEAASFPSGFAKIWTTAGDHDGGSFLCAWKRASSESGNYTVSWTTNTRNVGIMYAISGADTAGSPPFTAGTVATGSDNAPNPPSVDPGSSDDRLSVVIYGQEGKNDNRFSPPTTPGTYTEPTGSDGGTTGSGAAADHCGLGMAYRTYTGQTEDPGTATSGTTDGWAANTLIFDPAGGSTFTRTLTDNMGFSDTLSRVADGLRNPTDNLGFSPTASRVSDGLRNPSENLGFSPTASRIADAIRSITENLGHNTPDRTTSAILYRELLRQNLGQSDTATRIANALRNPIENLGFSDTVTTAGGALVIAVIESLGHSDTVTRLANALRNPTENLGFSDTATRLANALRNPSENLGFSPTVTRVADAIRSIIENMGFNTPDRTTSAILYRELLRQNLGQSDTTTRLANALRNPTENLGLSDTATISLIAGALSIAIIESMGLTEDPANRDLTAVDYRLLPENSLGFTDAASLNVSVARLLVAIAESLGISDTVSRDADALRSVVESLGISGTVSRNADALRAVIENLAISDTVSRVANALRSVSDSLGQSDTVTRKADALRQITDTIGFSDLVVIATSALIAMRLIDGGLIDGHLNGSRLVS